MRIFKRSHDGAHVELTALLSDSDTHERLNAIQALSRYAPPPPTDAAVKLRLRTTHSGTQETPSLAVWNAAKEGLCAAGLMDHDSVDGAWEFIAAAGALNFPVTVGLECRVSFAGTPLAETKLNIPGQKGVAYLALHAIPHNRLKMVSDWFTSQRETTYSPVEADDCAASDILPVGKVIAFALSNGSIPAYYVTFASGGSAAQDTGTEDVDALADCLHSLGVHAIGCESEALTYERFQALRAACRRYGLMELFSAEYAPEPEPSHLADMAWALIGHERRATENLWDGLFSPETVARLPELPRRTRVYRDHAKRLYEVAK